LYLLKPHILLYKVEYEVSADTNILVPVLKSVNYPNPLVLSAKRSSFETTIQFDLPYDQKIGLEIFDLKGRKVKDFSPMKLNKGTQTLKWDITDDNGKRVSSGIYLYKIKGDNYSTSGKITVVK